MYFWSYPRMWFPSRTLGRLEERGGRYSVMSNVWNKSQGPGICLSCHLSVFCIVMAMLRILAVVPFSHLESRDCCLFSAFVPLWTTWNFLGNSKTWSLFMGHMGTNVNVFIYVHSYLKYLFDKFVNVSRLNQCLYRHLNKPSSLYTFRTEKKSI